MTEKKKAKSVATSNPDKMRTYRTDVCTVWSGNDSAHVTVEAWGDFGGVYVKVCEGKQVQFVSLSLDQLGFLKVALASLDLPPTYLAENDSNHD